MSSRSWGSFIRAILILAGLLFGAACDPCPKCGGHHPPPPVTGSTGSGLFALDPTKKLAFVPLLSSPDPGSQNARVSVLDLSVNPNTTDPRKAVVVLGHPDSPTGTALDAKDALVIVVSGSSGQGGFVDLIDEDTDALLTPTPISMPAGSEPGIFGQVLYDATHMIAIISVTDSSSCPGLPGSCTGFITFDPVAKTFGNVIRASYAETFAYNQNNQEILDASDSNSAGKSEVVDVPGARSCNLADSNIGGDQDGASVDTTTDIFVVSNEDGTATVLNLNGSSLSGSSGSCTVTEGGTNPNSVLISGLPEETAGSAVNSTTHQGFLIEDDSNGITLVSLPSSPVTQIQSSDVSNVISSLPNDPNGCFWSTQGDPYAVAVDAQHNLGYAVNTFSSSTSGATFLVQVDLAKFQNDPAAISTALSAGNCAGTTSPFGCNNNNGVVFFALPPESESPPSCGG
jgi:hypothetical protein